MGHYNSVIGVLNMTAVAGYEGYVRPSESEVTL